MNFRKAAREIVRRFFPSEKEEKPEKKVKPQKVAIVIDGDNFYNALLDLGKLGIDLGEFKSRLSEGRELAKAIYYVSVDPEIPKEKVGFLKYLHSQGYKVEPKPISRKGEKPKSLIDPWVSDGIYRCVLNEEVSIIVLVSGDHHFVAAVKFAQERGKTVKVVSTPTNLSWELKKVSNEWLNLEEIIEGIPQIEIEKKREETLNNLKAGKTVDLSTLKTVK